MSGPDPRAADAGIGIGAPTAEGRGRGEAAVVATFWSHLAGWRLDVQADGATHRSYGDIQALMPQLARLVGRSDEQLQGWIGTLARPGR